MEREEDYGYCHRCGRKLEWEFNFEIDEDGIQVPIECICQER